MHKLYKLQESANLIKHLRGKKEGARLTQGNEVYGLLTIQQELLGAVLNIHCCELVDHILLRYFCSVVHACLPLILSYIGAFQKVFSRR